MAKNNNGPWTPKDIAPGGWFFIILIIGAIFWFGIKPHLGGSSVQSAVTTGTQPADDSASNRPLVAQATGSDIIVLTTKTKANWLSHEVSDFNNEVGHGKATMDVLESRDGMQKIMASAVKPQVWSPSHPMWINRLAIVDTGVGVDNSSSDTYRNLFKSPLVFLVNKSKLGALQPILSGPNPFDKIRGINARKPGSIRFGYADPLNASSGALTITLLLNEYADLHNINDLTQASKSQGFASWLGQVNRGLVKQNLSGSSVLEQAFETAPQSRDFITAYENSALAAVAANPNTLAIVYPRQTANAEQVAAILTKLASPDQLVTAKKFLAFIGSQKSLDMGATEFFRPDTPNGADALAASLPDAVKSQFHASYRAGDAADYDAINNANVVWHSQVKE